MSSKLNVCRFCFNTFESCEIRVIFAAYLVYGLFKNIS